MIREWVVLYAEQPCNFPPFTQPGTGYFPCCCISYQQETVKCSQHVRAKDLSFTDTASSKANVTMGLKNWPGNGFKKIQAPPKKSVLKTEEFQF